MKKLTVVLLVLLSTQLASAFGQTAATTIKYISVYPTATIIQVANTFGNEDGCTSVLATEYLIFATDGSEGSKILYSALLSAYITGTKVVLGYNGCLSDFPQMNRLDFVP